jgi:hypothetical protein
MRFSDKLLAENPPAGPEPAALGAAHIEWQRKTRRHLVARSLFRLEGEQDKSSQAMIAYILGLEYLDPLAEPTR